MIDCYPNVTIRQDSSTAKCPGEHLAVDGNVWMLPQ